MTRRAPDTDSVASLLVVLQSASGTFAERLAAQIRNCPTRMSRSLLSGLLLLAVFPTDGTPAKVAQLARTLEMNVSTVHRYVQTLAAVGLLERDPNHRTYRLPI